MLPFRFIASSLLNICSGVHDRLQESSSEFNTIEMILTLVKISQPPRSVPKSIE